MARLQYQSSNPPSLNLNPYKMNTTHAPSKVVRLFHYGHPRALFCCRACREGFKADRQSGLIYGPYFIRSLNRFAMCIEEASAIDKFCPYCNAKEGQPCS